MRDHGRLSPAFWTGSTGKRLRSSKDARILATYFLTGSNAHALGLYYVAVPTVVHETGLTEAEFWSALETLGQTGFAFYDSDREWVWVPNMASIQIAEALKEGDKRIGWVKKELQRYRGHRFLAEFVALYNDKYHLGLPNQEAPTKALPTPIHAPPKVIPLDQDLDQEVEMEGDGEPPCCSGEQAEADAIEPRIHIPGADPGMRADELLHALRVAVEREHPELGMYAPGSFAAKDAREFLESFAPDRAGDSRPLILARVNAFAKRRDAAKDGWTVKAFIRAFNTLAGPARDPDRPPAISIPRGWNTAARTRTT